MRSFMGTPFTSTEPAWVGTSSLMVFGMISLPAALRAA